MTLLQAESAPGEAHPLADSRTDEELMEQFVDGDRGAFDALFSRYSRPLRGYLARLVGPGAAADIAQTAFLSVVKARGRYQRQDRFRPWLYAIATNAARDHLRRHRREELTEEGSLPDDAAVSPAELRDAKLEHAVHAGLAQLPAAQREAILLHRFQGLAFSEIAEALDVSESAVKVRAHRGYARLRELLGALRDPW